MVSGRKYLHEFSQSLGIIVPNENVRLYERHILAQSESTDRKLSIVSHIQMQYGLFSSGQIRFLSIAISFLYCGVALVYIGNLLSSDGEQLKIFK